MSLQERLDAFKAEFEGNPARQDAVAIMHRATAALVTSGQAKRALKPGDRAPSFRLTGAEGDVVDSAELLAPGTLVITFYRGVWCPYCNMELEALQAVVGSIRALGAELVAISPQTSANGRKAKKDHGLTFPVLSDPGGRTAEAFGLRFRLPDDLVTVYRSFGIDLAKVNDDPSWTLPMPARYVVRQDGIIADAEVNPDYTRRPEPEQLLAVLRGLKPGLAA